MRIFPASIVSVLGMELGCARLELCMSNAAYMVALRESTRRHMRCTMTSGNAALRPAWAALQAHHASITTVHLRQLFAADSTRGERFALQAAGIYIDYSKNRITDETLKLLVRLAEESDLRG